MRHSMVALCCLLAVRAHPVRIPRDVDQRSELMSITIPK
jgi:hypothetical protein